MECGVPDCLACLLFVEDIQCFLCDENVPLAKASQHLLLRHRLVLSRPERVPVLSKYFQYWRRRFQEDKLALTHVCAKIDCDLSATLHSDVTTEEFHGDTFDLLLDTTPEDIQLRRVLHDRLLLDVIRHQQSERTAADVDRQCLFCRDFCSRERSRLLEHMNLEHHFNIGQPDNIVFLPQFLELLAGRMADLHCLYCQKVFPDKTVLREHMRKKYHRKIDPADHAYDKFYLINYLEPGKTWVELEKEPDSSFTAPDEWDDWVATSGDEMEKLVCLFCTVSFHGDSTANLDSFLQHMRDAHFFNWRQLSSKMNFYEQLKLVNFVREFVHKRKCHFCEEELETSGGSLLEHLNQTHNWQALPDRSVWDQPQYYMPFLDNDAFLCHLADPDQAVDT